MNPLTESYYIPGVAVEDRPPALVGNWHRIYRKRGLVLPGPTTVFYPIARAKMQDLLREWFQGKKIPEAPKILLQYSSVYVPLMIYRLVLDDPQMILGNCHE